MVYGVLAGRTAMGIEESRDEAVSYSIGSFNMNAPIRSDKSSTT